jgi:dipeptidase E
MASKQRSLHGSNTSVVDVASKKLVLYGGGALFSNVKAHKHLFSLVKKRHISVTYIPSSSQYGEMEFAEFCEVLRKKFSIKRFVYFPIDIPFTKEMSEMALEQDIVYMSGGNTYDFLALLRKTRLLDQLRAFSVRGGVLAGLSAGAILITPNISTAGFPHFDRDQNTAKMKNLKSLKLASFEFYPHYSHTPAYRKALISHSRKTLYPIYAAPDLSAVVIEGDVVRFVGPIHVFWNGKYYPPRY